MSNLEVSELQTQEFPPPQQEQSLEMPELQTQEFPPSQQEQSLNEQEQDDEENGNPDQEDKSVKKAAKTKKKRKEKKKKKESPSITIKIANASGNETHFKVKKRTVISKVFDRYCSNFDITTGSVRFTFDGNRVKETSTVEDLDLEEGDIIDVLEEQSGGDLDFSFFY